MKTDKLMALKNVEVFLERVEAGPDSLKFGPENLIVDIQIVAEYIKEGDLEPRETACMTMFAANTMTPKERNELARHVEDKMGLEKGSLGKVLEKLYEVLPPELWCNETTLSDTQKEINRDNYY